MVDHLNILAQQRDFDLSQLLYLLIFLVFPLLNSLGEWVRKKWGKNAQATSTEEDGDVVYDVTLGENDTLVLKPSTRADTARPAAVKPEARKTPPMIPVTPPAPAARTARPTPAPQAKPQPVARPAQPQAKRPQPARAHPATRHKSRPGPSAPEDAHRAHESREPVYEAILVEENREALPTARDLLAGEKLDAASLRKAIVLAEILSPPLATRDASSTPFARPQ